MNLSTYLVNYLSELRVKNGSTPVRYANTGYATFRANYMLRNKLFSHYDINGIPPQYYFTRLGHYFYMEEALGKSSTTSFFTTSDVIEESKKLIYDMIYNDENAGWGHRDTLLDPCFNYADISVAYNSHEIYLVVAMLNARIDWVLKPMFKNGVVRFQGKILGDMIPTSVFIYRDVADPKRVNSLSYSLGEIIAGVVPKPYYYKGVKTIRPLEWYLSESFISVSFPFQITEKGIYTIVVHAKDKRGIVWRPYTNRRVGECEIMMYSILTASGTSF